MELLLKELQETKLVRVTGSFADGSYSENSDIDFYIKPDRPDSKKRNISKIIEILKKYKINLDSNFPGYIYTHKSTNMEIERELEFSDLFHPRKNKLAEVEIMGVKFKTY